MPLVTEIYLTWLMKLEIDNINTEFHVNTMLHVMYHHESQERQLSIPIELPLQCLRRLEDNVQSRLIASRTLGDECRNCRRTPFTVSIIVEELSRNIDLWILAFRKRLKERDYR